MILAILRLKDKGAYGISIRKEISEKTESKPSPGAIYTILERLESKGLVKFFVGGAAPKRGSRAKRFYQVTKDKIGTLQRSQREYKSLLQKLDVFGERYT